MSATTTVQQLPTDVTLVQFEVLYPDVTPQQLFNWWLDPEKLCKWWSQEAETQPETGGSYRLYWKSLNVTLRGVYTVFEPGQRLNFTWKWDHETDRPERLVQIILNAENDGTRLLLTHGIYTPGDTEERQEHQEGWAYFLDNLAKHAMKQSDSN
ncbi:MAG TPA: SRPBCC domain-containing protein [Phototrophicaceae bacterium]|jgi:uncharacterized protein YndB with AHSA1/START domain|nr:SRPBCC domain-containing protein [Phototrophicaceae bacterium]